MVFFGFLNLYSALFTAVKNIISIYTYINDIKTTIHWQKYGGGLTAMGDYTKYVLVLKYTVIVDENEREIIMGDIFNNERCYQCVIILI